MYRTAMNLSIALAILATLGLAATTYAHCGNCPGDKAKADAGHSHAKAECSGDSCDSKSSTAKAECSGDSCDSKSSTAKAECSGDSCDTAKADCSDCAKAAPTVATVGEPAPLFALTDIKGKTVSLADLTAKEKVVVLEWFNPDCPYVKKHYEKMSTMKNLALEYKDKGVVWLSVNSTKYADSDYNKKWAKKWAIKHHLLIDQSGDVGRLYQARTTPHMFVIDRTGKLVYDGAIDSHRGANKPGSDEKVTNYVKTALKSVLAGEKVETAKTKPYGCGVKYAKPVESKQASSESKSESTGS